MFFEEVKRSAASHDEKKHRRSPLRYDQRRIEKHRERRPGSVA